MKQVVIYTICMGVLLSRNILQKYNRPDVDMEGLYRDPISVNDTLVSDTTNMGNLPWEEVSPPITEINSSGTGTKQ